MHPDHKDGADVPATGPALEHGPRSATSRQLTGWRGLEQSWMISRCRPRLWGAE